MNRLLFVQILFVLSIFAESNRHVLISIKKINPSIKTEIVYATTRNFTGKIIYQNAECFVRNEVACALNAVQKELEHKGLGLKIWDAYRPLSAQWKLWEICPDEKYVSDPRKGGRHTRGTAVDVTLIDLKSGKELEMPTGFDDFSEKAWSDYAGASYEAKMNRALLQAVMAKYGFTGIATEWWHFDYKDWQNYPVLDIEL
jgi:D-alanyl-D-alanine dipeptidase